MDTKNLTDLNPATLAALAKLAAQAAKAGREGLEEGKHKVDAIVTLSLDAEVSVGKDHFAEAVQKAKPWSLVHLLLTELNKLRAAAGLTGMDLDMLVQMAEKVDDEIADKAKKAADEAMRALKEPTKSPRKGSVSVKGEVKVPVA